MRPPLHGVPYFKKFATSPFKGFGQVLPTSVKVIMDQLATPGMKIQKRVNPICAAAIVLDI